MHFTCGLVVGLTGLAAGYCIGIVGDNGVRAYMKQSRVYVGMILILIFGEVLGLYGYVNYDLILVSGCHQLNIMLEQTDCRPIAQFSKQGVIGRLFFIKLYNSYGKFRLANCIYTIIQIQRQIGMEGCCRTAGESVGYFSNIMKHLHLDCSPGELGIETMYIMVAKKPSS